jgi:hypothetical protein
MDVEPWCRYNTFVYANRTGAERLAAQARACLLTATQAVPNIAPLAWRLRCCAISVLPPRIANIGARIKHRFVNRIRSEHR